MTARQPGEAMHKAEAADTAKPGDDFRLQRVVKIEQKVSIGWKAVREQRLRWTEFVLRVMRPEALFTDRRRRDDGPITITVLLKIDHREEVAVGAVLIAGPRKQVPRYLLC